MFALKHHFGGHAKVNWPDMRARPSRHHDECMCACVSGCVWLRLVFVDERMPTYGLGADDVVWCTTVNYGGPPCQIGALNQLLHGVPVALLFAFACELPRVQLAGCVCVCPFCCTSVFFMFCACVCVAISVSSVRCRVWLRFVMHARWRVSVCVFVCMCAEKPFRDYGRISSRINYACATPPTNANTIERQSVQRTNSL